MNASELACLCVLLEKFLDETHMIGQANIRLYEKIYDTGKEAIMKDSKSNSSFASIKFYELCEKVKAKLPETLTTRLIGG